MWFFAFYCVSLGIVVWATVLVVESHHVESVTFRAAVARDRSQTNVQARTRQHRHRAALLAPRGGDANSARAICARVTAELARATTDQLREIGLDDTDRLFTHGAMLEMAR